MINENSRADFLGLLAEFQQKPNLMIKVCLLRREKVMVPGKKTVFLSSSRHYPKDSHVGEDPSASVGCPCEEEQRWAASIGGRVVQTQSDR